MRDAGLAWTIGLTIGIISAPLAWTRKINTCMTFEGRLGDDTDPNVWQYTNPSIKTKNLEEVDLPDPVVTKIVDMVEHSSSYKETTSNSNSQTAVETTEWEGSEEDPDARYDGSNSKSSSSGSGSGSGSGSRSDCIPRPSKAHRRKRESSKKKKKPYKCVWPKKKKKKPYCDELTTKAPPSQRRPVTFIIERVSDKKGGFTFTVTVNKTIKETTRTYTQDRVYTIKVTKTKLYTITMAKKPTSTDITERNSINTLYQIINSFYGQGSFTRDTFTFDTVTTLVWSKVDGHYRLTEINMVTITCLEDLCGDTMSYVSYRKKLSSKVIAKKSQTTADLIQKDSEQYKKLFSSEDSFKFSNWYKIYTSTVIAEDFGGETFKVVEKFKNADQGQVKFIKIIWDSKTDVKSFTMIAFLYSSAGGAPVITVKDFGMSNKGVASYQVLVRYFRRTSALALNVASSYVTVSQGIPDDTIAGQIEVNFNYTYVKKVHDFNFTAQAAWAANRKRRALEMESNNVPYWRRLLAYVS
ncbi:unnamed protein product [Allacma fusca]|uniref:Uncharacterized protein n=1 Tax=Allacma fusca TaxID=39272 RepID=A0A8J2L4A1_9HEXA|nr:unnamed protein product [Allacma fusca]